MAAIPYPVITPYTWTVDVEYDWGGRTNGASGIREGLPRILETFKERNVKGLFFISTELLRDFEPDIRRIKEDGHELGSHGHFHIRYDNQHRTADDMEISKNLLSRISGTNYMRYRSPRFNTVFDDFYSNPRNHVSVLKQQWFGAAIPKRPIFYVHPFDLVGGSNPPNIFCNVWYSNPLGACKKFKELVGSYPGLRKLK